MIIQKEGDEHRDTQKFPKVALSRARLEIAKLNNAKDLFGFV